MCTCVFVCIYVDERILFFLRALGWCVWVWIYIDEILVRTFLFVSCFFW